MKKIYCLPLFVCMTIFLPAFADSLTPQEALARFENQSPKSRSQDNLTSFNLSYTFKAKDNEPALYVFNKNNDQGYVVLSAEESAPVLLGYSDNGYFNPDEVSPELNYWFGEYSNQIAYLRNNNTTTLSLHPQTLPKDWPAISPLLKSKWNQGEPYNKYCYTIASDGRETQSVTGCVATSMAQVMYYFKYPEVGHGNISYKFDDSGTYSMDFGTQPFQWNDMLPIYYPQSYTAAQEDAVAYLMKSCGYSVRMDYGKGESGASGTAIAGALIDYFGYKEDISIQTRKFHTYEDWAQLIYDNLSEVGPVIYNGSALDGGHSFVCDGYDGNGYFHFNWGWGGMSDGYYLLDALNPDEFGIGGAAGGYNLGQQIILGISPDKQIEIPRQVMQFGNVTGKINQDTHILSFELTNATDAGFQYINPEPITVTFGIMVKNESDASQALQYFESDKKNLEGKQGTYFSWKEVGLEMDLSKVAMTEGEEYDFILATSITAGNTSEWNETCVMPGKYNYVTIIKTSDDYKITNYSVDNLQVSDFKVESSPIYYDMPVKFSATFINNSTQALTRNYSAVLFNAQGEECFKMENFSVNVDANSSESNQWTSVQWYKEKDAEEVTESTDFTLKLYDNWEGIYVEGIERTVTVLPKSESETKIESQLTILDAQKEGDTYVVEGNQFEATLNVKVLEGALNHTLMLAIQMPLSNGDYYTVFHKHFDGIPDLTAGEEQTFDISVIFEDAQPDKVYRVEVWGPDGGFNEETYLRFNLTNDNVDSLASDLDSRVRIYSIDGKEIYTGNNSQILNSLPHGLYIINGKKIFVQ